MEAPLDKLEAWLPAAVQRVAARETPIPSIAARARAAAARRPSLVRADIGQIAGLDPSLEVLYGPPVGLDPLRAALAETYNRAFGLDLGDVPGLSSGLTPAHVTVCTGAAEGLSMLFTCFAEGRVVALPRAHWENYSNAVELAGGRTALVDYFDARGRLDLEGLERALQAHGAQVLVANFPANPTGAVLSEAETRALAALAERLGLVLIADEVYARLRYDGQAPVTLLRYAPGNAVVVASASKEYLLPGARVGYVFSSRSDLTDRVLRKLLRARTGSPGVLGQERLLALLTGDLEDLRAGRAPEVLTRVRDTMKSRRDALLPVLVRHGLDPVGRPGHAPEGTIFLMARLPGWFQGDDAAFAQAALEEGVVSTIPGSAFGLPGTVRFSYGSMAEADIDRLDRNLAAWKRG
ncbi:MAG: pyridoxal phosphate-dependent aminotransferase [Deltaproteobacteria bacterium]|nr:pyridoxal phosphate-dependent aminotransferase [Deltaproteobacteria bacterium]